MQTTKSQPLLILVTWDGRLLEVHMTPAGLLGASVKFTQGGISYTGAEPVLVAS